MPRTAVDQSDPDGVLRALAALAATRREHEQELAREEAVLVRRARNEGIVWEQIAASLGVSKQAVHKKHGGRRVGRPVRSVRRSGRAAP